MTLDSFHAFNLYTNVEIRLAMGTWVTIEGNKSV